MQPKYCLPIIKYSMQDVLQVIEENLEDYAYFEVWLDYIDDLDRSFVDGLIQKLGKRLVVVFRRQNLEPTKIQPDQRLNYLAQFDGTAAFVDLDINDQLTELTSIASHRQTIQTIISCHNYQETPSDQELHDIIEQIRPFHPAVLKISTLCQNEMDAVRLLSLLLELRESKQKCIILGMGEYGTITRIFGTLWGNELTFAPENTAEASAPAQLTRIQLQTILRTLNQ